MDKLKLNLYESIQHSLNAPAKVFITSVRNSAYHWHNDYELIAVLKGRLDVFYSLYGGEPQRLSAGDVILINPRGVHEIRGIDPDNVCVCVQFSPKMFEPVPADMKYYFFLNSVCSEYTPEMPYRHYLEMIARMSIAHRSDKKDSLLRENAWLYMLLADFMSGVPYELRSTPANSEKNIELVMKISSYINENLTEENLPDMICKEFGLSTKGVYLLLKDHLGLSLKDMIDTVRVETACELLRDSEIPLQVISDRCGYSGEATFYRRFRRAMGITPGEYRKGIVAETTSNEIQDYLSLDESKIDGLLYQWI